MPRPVEEVDADIRKAVAIRDVQQFKVLLEEKKCDFPGIARNSMSVECVEPELQFALGCLQCRKQMSCVCRTVGS
jgi:hypothetical protein